MPSLHRGLAELDGKWLICLGNADNASVNRIIGEVTKKARSCEGWAVVTSRQGVDAMWQDMVAEQKLRLIPLGVDKAMIALYRYKENISNGAALDGEVAERVAHFENANQTEYRALFELAGHKTEWGLGGLPLALNEAGSFIRRRKISFSKYLELYKLRALQSKEKKC